MAFLQLAKKLWLCFWLTIKLSLWQIGEFLCKYGPKYWQIVYAKYQIVKNIVFPDFSQALNIHFSPIYFINNGRCSFPISSTCRGPILASFLALQGKSNPYLT